MDKSTFAAAAALALCTFTGTASANDTLQSRAMSALGTAIASQGNAALLQIRQELKESATEVMRPFLPASAKVPGPQPSLEAASAQR